MHIAASLRETRAVYKSLLSTAQLIENYNNSQISYRNQI